MDRAQKVSFITGKWWKRGFDWQVSYFKKMTSSVTFAQAMSHTYEGWSLFTGRSFDLDNYPHGQTGADLKEKNAEPPPECTFREMAPRLLGPESRGCMSLGPFSSEEREGPFSLL